MADKTTTLKTKTNDNVYPNVIGDNRDNAIVDSAHIKHTLTADHKINFRIDDNVSKLIFNSLQKPAGLTKTKLVGVGTSGQENIEIGDNLTLANGKLSATGGTTIKKRNSHFTITAKAWNVGDTANGYTRASEFDSNAIKVYPLSFFIYSNNEHSEFKYNNIIVDDVVFNVQLAVTKYDDAILPVATCIKAGTVSTTLSVSLSISAITE